MVLYFRTNNTNRVAGGGLWIYGCGDDDNYSYTIYIKPSLVRLQSQ